MITIPTCLVLGAGASAPYGFPTGAGLRKKILQRLSKPNDKVWNALIQAGIGGDLIETFSVEFEESQQESVDAFLAHRPDFHSVGKTAIAAVLIRYERLHSLLEPQPPGDEDNWYRYLWARLQDGGEGRFSDNRLSVVTFNYDRSLEEFLVRTYQRSFAAQREQAEGRVRETIRIVHVHGKLGELSEATGGGGKRPYSDSLDRTSLDTAREGIIVLSEAEKTSDEFRRARQMVLAAEQVIFLGFGYHQENLTRLGIHLIQEMKESARPGEAYPQTLSGSAFGFTQREKARVDHGWGIRMGHEDWGNLRYLRENVDFDV